MAEAIAAISFVSVVWSLADYGTKVVRRLNEFRANIRDLPEAFQHISDQLPLLIDTVNHLHDQAKDGSLSQETETALRPVVAGIHTQVIRLDTVLVKVLPSAKASTWERGFKAFKSLGYQKTVDDFASVIDRYVSNLTAYQTTSNGALIKTLITLIEQTSLQAVQASPPRKPCFTVRYETDEDFIGREDIMEEIRQRFDTGNRVAIAGIGGVGKSRIAIEYCFEHRRKNLEAHVFWVHGANKARLEAAYQDIARKLRLPGFEDSKINTLQLVCDWLSDEDNGSWLMVLDNADDADIWTGLSTGEVSQQETPQQSAPLINYIPRGCHGFVLITTRDSQLGKILTKAKKKPIDVLRFGPKQAEILLRRKLSEDDDISAEDANEITEALDYLPLAITQAAAYLDQNNITIAKYYQLLRSGKADTSDLLKKSIHDPGRDYEIQNSVFQTWKMSFDQISRQDPRSAEILSLMAVLDRQAISENLLRKEGESEIEFNAAIQKLRAFSLITKETNISIFSMHRLVQLSIQKWLELEHVIEEWQKQALFVVSKYSPLDGKYEDWAAWEAINPHVQVVLGYVFEMDLCLEQRASILTREAAYHREQGRYKTTHSKAMEALAICEKFLGQDHSLTLKAVNLLGTVYAVQERPEEAEAMYQRALAGRKKVLGPDHEWTLHR